MRRIWPALLMTACLGDISTPLPPIGINPPEKPLTLGVASYPGAIILTAREYDAAVRVLLGDDSHPGAQLPNPVSPTTTYPFDNLWEQTVVSAPKVDTYEQLAMTLSTSFLSDPARMQAHLPCIPASSSDAGCFAAIIERVGLLALRRPLTAAEKANTLDAFSMLATQTGDYKDGLEIILRVFLQHPDFLFRWEVGTPTDSTNTTFALNDFEVASKLSFTLWGEPPSLELLDAAANGELASADGLTSWTDQMLADPRAIDHLDFFHAAWLGYSQLEGDGLQDSLRAESKALVKRVIFDEARPWGDVLSLDESWVDSTLIDHYGLPSATTPGWIKQPDSKRLGLLGTGSFLSAAPGIGETSTTQRGYNIRKNVFCEVIPPPPANVNKDAPPMDPNNSSRCTQTQLQATVLSPNDICVGCHQKMNPIGFGLEQYSSSGVFRTTQPDAPECSLSGDGNAVGYGTFNGPTALGTLALDSGRFERCMVTRFMQLTNRRKLDPNIEALADAAAQDFSKDRRLTTFVRTLVASDAFRQRAALEP